MRKLYEKSELTFAIICIVVFSILQSLANPLNKIIGIEYSANAIFCILMLAILFVFIKKNNLMKKYGLCKSSIPSYRFLFYVPLIILATRNFWNGAAINFNLTGAICYITYMLCVGFIEEVIFRGFLFKAVAKDNIKIAVVISSVTFGLGHLLHLINGSGAELAENLFQVTGAIAVGFLFVVLFHRGGSLLPCVITHSAINITSTFANETGLKMEKRIIFQLILFVITVVYAFILTKTLPEKSNSSPDLGERT